MIKLPVYFDLNGIHQIAIFQETEEGTFRRTTDQPMRLLRDNIVGIGPSVGELVTTVYDREPRPWVTPTISFNHRKYSFYQFLRQQASQRKIFVFSKPSMNGRLNRFDVHELQLKPNASLQVQSLLMKKLIDSIGLDLDHEIHKEQEQASNIVA